MFAISGASIAIVLQFAHKNKANAARAFVNLLKAQLFGLRNIVTGIFGAVVSANMVALIMSKVLDRSLSWFSRESLPVLLYAPPSIFGALLPQLAFISTSPVASSEAYTLTALLLLFTASSTILQCIYQVGSAAFLFVPGCALCVTLALHTVLDGKMDEIPLRSYIASGIVSLIIGVEVWCGTADVFVPLVR